MYPKVSIIILNWNTWEDTIECLESLYQISYPNYEVIVVDNNSIDKTFEEAKQFGAIVVKEKIQGYGACCIRALKEANNNADLIVLVEGDQTFSTKDLKELLAYTRHLGMEALVEVHDKTDLVKAIYAGSDIIGINHRNLKTFEMNMNLCYDLIPLIPNGKIIVAESGIYEHGQLEDLSKAGVDAFLVGESLMRTDDEESALRTLKNG